MKTGDEYANDASPIRAMFHYHPEYYGPVRLSGCREQLAVESSCEQL